MIQDLQAFINYFGGVRRRTLNYIQAIPQDKFGRSPKPGKFEYGLKIEDIVELTTT